MTSRITAKKPANPLCHGSVPVGRAVISDSRDPWFESRHRQLRSLATYRRRKLKKKSPPITHEGPLRIRKQDRMGCNLFKDELFHAVPKASVNYGKRADPLIWSDHVEP